MSSEIGNILKVSVFGASHDIEIGVDIKGFPKDEYIDETVLQEFLNRRRPGSTTLGTPRVESDTPIFSSGILNGRTTGEPIHAIIKNTNVHSKDYEHLKYKPRPGHADYTAYEKFGIDFDMSGGGPFSGRLTAPLCIAGGMCKQYLAQRGIFIGAHLKSVGHVTDDSFPLMPSNKLFKSIEKKPLALINDNVKKEIQNEIEAARADKDSIGAVIECAIIDLPKGLGWPMFNGIENRLAAAIFGIPAVKGIEFGAGFDATKMKGSENNDPFTVNNGRIETISNNHGGALGGITTGMPVVFRTAFKPTPSIGKEQHTVNLSTMENTTITINGRHDPCVAIRAVPAVEAVAAIVITDMLLEAENEAENKGD